MNIMKFFGFDTDDDDYDEDDGYTEEKRRKQPSRREPPSRSSTSGNSNAAGKLILFNGVASDNDKRRLREAFNNGAMILIDLHEMNQREFEEAGKDFITFMGGVAFARNGEMKFIEPSQYLVTPRSEMFEVWPEEEVHE
ncbi:MAG: cell division protein SepF [Synergistaceae bacterium]|nr:cell division protein SepF [Synergistaceae bacterium]